MQLCTPALTICTPTGAVYVMETPAYSITALTVAAVFTSTELAGNPCFAACMASVLTAKSGKPVCLLMLA